MEQLETIKLTPDQERARKRRNIMIAAAIVAFVVLVFFISVAQIRAGVAAGAHAHAVQ